MHLTTPVRTFLSAGDLKRDRMATFGLIVRQSDETIETEIRHFTGSTDMIVHHTRVADDAMGMIDLEHLPHAVRLLPARTRFDAIGVACLKTATFIGAQAIDRIVKPVFPDTPVTNPLLAVRAYLAHYGMTRIGLLTAEDGPAETLLQNALSDAGIMTTSAGTFAKSDAHTVARVATADVLYALEGIAESGVCEAILIASTNLPSATLLKLATRRTGRPVFSANGALAWHMTALADESRVR